LTEFLYSGEQFDSKIGQQYLRARYYDPATGRFNRLDPFFGNINDPQSLHKYLYTHTDPVNGIDPSGKMNVAACIGAIGIGLGVASLGLNVYRAGDAFANGDYNAAAEHLQWALVDLFLLIFPYERAAKELGTAYQGLRICVKNIFSKLSPQLVLQTINGAEVTRSGISLLRSGIKPSGVYGWSRGLQEAYGFIDESTTFFSSVGRSSATRSSIFNSKTTSGYVNDLTGTEILSLGKEGSSERIRILQQSALPKTTGNCELDALNFFLDQIDIKTIRQVPATSQGQNITLNIAENLQGLTFTFRPLSKSGPPTVDVKGVLRQNIEIKWVP
jgi:RHS repeat-associated protein